MTPPPPMPPPRHTDHPPALEAFYAGANAAAHNKPRLCPPRVAPKQQPFWLEGHDAYTTLNPEPAPQ